MAQSKIHYVGQLQQAGKADNIELFVEQRADLTLAERSNGIKWVDPRYNPGDVRRYGAVGDGATDDTAAFNAMISFAGAKYVPKPSVKYKLDPILFAGLSDVHIYIEPGTLFEANTGFGANDRWMDFTGSSNISFNAPGGAIFQMLKAEYTTGEQRHAFFMTDCTDIWINGITASDSGGDGFYVGARETYGERIYVTNCVSDNNRRQGVTVTSGVDIFFINHISKNTIGTSPQAGYDIEPNGPSGGGAGDLTGTLENIHFTNCSSYNNAGAGFAFIGGVRAQPSTFECSVFFTDCYDYGSVVNFSHQSSLITRGLVSFANCHGQNALANGLNIESCRTPMSWTGGYITNPNQDGNSNARDGSAVAVFSTNKTDGSTYGHVSIKGLTVEDPDDNMVATVVLQTVSEATSIIENVDIEINAFGIAATKRTHNTGGLRAHPISIKYLDNPIVPLSGNTGASSTIAYANQKITNTGAVGATNFTISSGTSQEIGGWYEFEITVAQTFTVTADASNILPGAVTTWASSTIGSKLRVEWDGANWQITNQIGTWA